MEEECRCALEDGLTVKVLGEEHSGVRGHRAAPARVLDVVAAAVDATVLGVVFAAGAVRRRTGCSELGALQPQRRYVAGAVVFVQTEPGRSSVTDYTTDLLRSAMPVTFGSFGAWDTTMPSWPG